jgi:SNF2 family DNA or RNA helicase
MRLAAKDHLDMPELIPNDIFIDLPPEARRIYKQLDDEFVAIMGDAVVMAPTAGVVGMKLRQVANGGLYDSDHFAHHIHDAKTQALVDLVDQLQGQPLLVGYEFQHDLDRIRRVYPNAPSFTGATGAKLDKLVDDFNAGAIPLALAHPASAGHGLNLQGSCYNICFYGLTWDLELYTQLIARIWRQGQKSDRVMLHRILASNTRDQDVAEVLIEKDMTQEKLFQALTRRQYA